MAKQQKKAETASSNGTSPVATQVQSPVLRDRKEVAMTVEFWFSDEENLRLLSDQKATYAVAAGILNEMLESKVARLTPTSSLRDKLSYSLTAEDVRALAEHYGVHWEMPEEIADPLEAIRELKANLEHQAAELRSVRNLAGRLEKQVISSNTLMAALEKRMADLEKKAAEDRLTVVKQLQETRTALDLVLESVEQQPAPV